MLHYVHQLVTNFVSLTFGAGPVAYSWFTRSFLLKTAATAGNPKTNLKHYVELNGTTESGDNPL